MTQLAQVYFSKIVSCYKFIDRQLFFELLNMRWRSGGRSNIYDAVLAGIAALGLLFSERTVELHLAESARSMLESYNGCSVPFVDLMTGWTLRVVYTRMTAPPYPT